MTLQYKLQVKGLLIGGHPHQEFASNEINAFRRFDELVEFYKDYEVSLFLLKEEVIRTKERVVKPKVCPRGHEGIRDGKSIIDGGGMCTVCGEWAR